MSAAFLFGINVAEAITVFYSNQVGSTPSAGRVLQTDGTNSTWVATSSLGFSGSGSAATTTINGASGPAFTFATGSATGIGLTVSTSTGTVTFTPTVSSGYSVPLTASTTNWNNFYDTPSTRITAGTNLQWSGNTLNNTFAISTSSLNYWTLGNGFLRPGTTTDLIGIGTSTPYYTLDILGKGGAAPIRISSSTGVSLFEIKQNGNVGIASTTAANTLTVGGTIYASSTITSLPLGTNKVVASTNGTLVAPSSAIASWMTLFDGASYVGGNGVLVSAGGSPTTRVITGTSGQVDVANGNGSAGNPTLSLPVTVNGINRINSASSTDFTIAPGTANNNVLLLPTGTGKVGINSASPATTLYVKGNGGTNPFSIASSTGTDMVTVLQNGNVGIGVSAPTAKVHVINGDILVNKINDGGGDSVLIGDGPSGGYPGIWIGAPGAAPTYANYSFLRDNVYGTLLNSDLEGIALRVRNGGVAAINSNGMSIGYGNPIYASQPGSGVSLVTSGKAGFGTTTPKADLHVNNATANATTTIQFGRGGMGKPTCEKLYRLDGTAVYRYIDNSNVMQITTTSCSVSVF